jgi:hypothetical protein
VSVSLYPMTSSASLFLENLSEARLSLGRSIYSGGCLASLVFLPLFMQVALNVLGMFASPRSTGLPLKWRLSNHLFDGTVLVHMLEVQQCLARRIAMLWWSFIAA